MHCPGCGIEMQRLTLDAVLAATVDIDVCTTCRAFWFDPYESLHLTAASTLQLFKLIAGAANGQARPAHEPRCPYCKGRLVLAHDRQRNVPFQYWRCDHDHGRFTGFFDFLKEKNFVVPMSESQIVELRKKVAMIHCANCGAPIELAKTSVCGHCGSPLSMLDLPKMAETVQHLEVSATKAAHPPALVPVHHEPVNLLEWGLEALAEWLGW